MATAEHFSDQSATLKSCYSKSAFLHCRQCSICCRENQSYEPMTSDSINTEGVTFPTYRKMWNDDEAFITDNLREIYGKLPKLENEIWGKLIVMEENCRILKAYLRHSNIQIDGSDSVFDGKKLGLKKFSTNDKIIKAIYQQVKNGLNISMDHDGNLWAKRVCQCPVFARSFGDSDLDVIRIEKRPTKIFDIQSLKKNLICSSRKISPAVLNTDRELEKMCFVCLQIGCREKTLLKAPSWLIIVHLVALEFLNVFAAKVKSRISSTKLRQSSSDQCSVEESGEGRDGKMYSEHITSDNARNRLRTKSQDSGFHSNGEKFK